MALYTVVRNKTQTTHTRLLLPPQAGTIHHYGILFIFLFFFFWLLLLLLLLLLILLSLWRSLLLL